MKKFLLSLVLVLPVFLQAQQRLVIVSNDGKADTIPVWKIENIHFLDFEKPETAIPEAAVDLGLESGLLWAPWNIGAADASESGFLFGWGNPDPENHSTDLKYFPSSSTKANIITTEYDIAQYYWGAPWHMPTDADFDELIMNCSWEWDDTMNAYKVTGPNQNFIYMPISGFAQGETMPDDDGGYYWTGVYAANDSAKYLYFPSRQSEMSPWELRDGFRSKRLAVRPVYGEYKIPVTISATEAEVNIDSEAKVNANIRVKVKGKGENLTYGILLSQMPNVGESADKYTGTLELLEDSCEKIIQLTSLAYDTKYYYRAFVQVGQDIYIEAEDDSLQTPVDERIVDLGLHVKWGRWNIGATSEGGYGYLVAWGARTEYDVALDVTEMTTLSGVDDIANNEWGEGWRIPTRDEFEELKTYCTATSDYVDGHFGVRFSRNGDSIFLPFCGYGSSSASREKAGIIGCYWSSEGYTHTAFGIYISSPEYDDFFQINAVASSGGRGIRAVYGANDSSNFIENPDEGGSEVDPVVPVDPGTQTDTTTVEPENPVSEEVQAVDLGLTSGTLWANKNIGAATSTDAGFYYSWGEVDSVKTDNNYLRKNYLYYDQEKQTFARIGNAGSVGIAGTEYDAATVTWGGDWKMPTPAQFEELEEECLWTWTTQDGVPGYLISSTTNSNSIFLPSVGFYNGRSKSSNEICYYWSSSLYLFGEDINDEDLAMALYIDSSKHTMRYHAREDGLPIRPILTK